MHLSLFLRRTVVFLVVVWIATAGLVVKLRYEHRHPRQPSGGIVSREQLKPLHHLRHPEGAFPRDERSRRLKFAAEMHSMQVECRDPLIIRIPDHGMGVDLSHVARRVLQAFTEDRSYRIFATTTDGWHYARGVCVASDLTCFFEDTTWPCVDVWPPPPSTRGDGNRTVQPTVDDVMWYLTRPLPHVRKAIEKQMSSVGVDVDIPTAAVHVRRSDIVLNKGWDQKGNKSAPSLFRYIPLEEYLTDARAARVLESRRVQQLLLMTDDASVIEEVDGSARALVHWRDKWHWIDRKRFRGAEGGWENHFPADSHFDEVVTILALRELVAQCVVWIGTQSSFARFLRQRKPFEVVNLDSHERSHLPA